MYPPALVERPIKSMVPARVCTECGRPSERITETTNTVTGAAPRHEQTQRRADASDANAWKAQTGATCSSVSLGWTDCGHNSWRNGVVLDPFAGSGTTLMVATGHGRDAIGIDLDERNADLAIDRVGPLMLTVEHLAADGVA